MPVKKADLNEISDEKIRSVLNVITRLEVGPVRLEKRRLVAPYRIKCGNKDDSMDFIYRFEEDVFEPSETVSKNLASMMAVQVALNYGLFCKEIKFNGIFDRHDRQFIKDMMSNTAKEIFVMKFLKPNPFIEGKAAKIPPVKLDNYNFSNITYSDELFDWDKIHKIAPWPVKSNRFTVLSSGGKDSLLSFGLLRETGVEPHPIFINESGRHWFTALNTYRNFILKVPNTARVWTNSDRLFAWMLRHLSFIRKDFGNIRSDEYPIRLWTVAVFIFGVLPLLRKRNIGNLVIGDEYDTSVKQTYRGIPHYNGLYDQSLYFDNTLSRYYERKGWGIKQFSLIRPLSELLIEKTLEERYPELQKLQVSCHATHTEGETVKPCGNCEKCRRIVGMLAAIGADPSLCGYSKKAFDNCMEALARLGVHQEKEGAQHLAFLLKDKELIPENSLFAASAKKRSEILKLRFDIERSPMDGIPLQLRKKIYKIFLEHADGAVMRNGRNWEILDILNAPEVKVIDMKNSKKHKRTDDDRNRFEIDDRYKDESYLLGNLTWPEAKKKFKRIDLALLPVGSIEQHGSHLPLDTDSFDADYLAKRVAEECSDPKPVVLPLIPYGVSYHHEDFTGTISISPKTLANIVYEVGMSLIKHGIKKLVIINGHGGNKPALQFASQMINRDGHIFTCVDTGETSDEDLKALTETQNDVHSGEIETSTSLAVRPELVKFDKARKFVPKFSSRYLDFSSKRSVEWYTRTVKISPSGILGDPLKASREKGMQMWDIMIKRLVEFIEDLKSMNLEEIYQRRL